MSTARAAAVAAAVALACPASASAADIKRGGCRAVADGEWTVLPREQVANGPGGATIRLVESPAPMISMTEGSDFQRVEQNERLIIFRRKLAQGRSHLRSITRTSPSCTADIVMSSRSEEDALQIARTLTQVAPNR